MTHQVDSGHATLAEQRAEATGTSRPQVDPSPNAISLGVFTKRDDRPPETANSLEAFERELDAHLDAHLEGTFNPALHMNDEITNHERHGPFSGSPYSERAPIPDPLPRDRSSIELDANDLEEIPIDVADSDNVLIADELAEDVNDSDENLAAKHKKDDDDEDEFDDDDETLA
jgi:hypothetical protein